MWCSQRSTSSNLNPFKLPPMTYRSVYLNTAWFQVSLNVAVFFSCWCLDDKCECCLSGIYFHNVCIHSVCACVCVCVPGPIIPVCVSVCCCREAVCLLWRCGGALSGQWREPLVRDGCWLGLNLYSTSLITHSHTHTHTHTHTQRQAYTLPLR